MGTSEHQAAASAVARAKVRPGVPVLIIVRNPQHSADAVMRECNELLEGSEHQVRTGHTDDGAWIEVTVGAASADSGDMPEPPILL